VLWLSSIPLASTKVVLNKSISSMADLPSLFCFDTEIKAVDYHGQPPFYYQIPFPVHSESCIFTVLLLEVTVSFPT
jgi:hypothetical protein